MPSAQEVGAEQRQTERVADNDDLTRKIISSSLVHIGEGETKKKGNNVPPSNLMGSGQ